MAGKYGERWGVHKDADGTEWLMESNGDLLIEPFMGAALRRIVQCVNACEGIADPAAVIEAARDVCRHESWDEGAQGLDGLGQDIARLRALLEPKAVNDGDC